MAADSADDEHVRPAHAARLTVEGVVVAPPVTERQAQGLAAVGWLADTPDSLVDVWHRIERTWARTVDDARERPAAELDVRVDDEWSFIETLRHLVFVTDAWITIGVLGGAHRHPLGVPPDFVPHPRELGLDLDAKPALDDVLAARADKQALVRATLGSLDASGLARPCHGHLSQFTALGAVQVVMTEEAAHHRFATRDLAKIEG